MGVAFEKRDEDVKRRVDFGRIGVWALEAARRQLRQIMVGVVGLAIELRHDVWWYFQKFGMGQGDGPDLFLRPRGAKGCGGWVAPRDSHTPEKGCVIVYR
jgi:hypothetical protein